MIIIANDQDGYDSAMSALGVISRLRQTRTYPTRPDWGDYPWVRTVWPNENYL